MKHLRNIFKIFFRYFFCIFLTVLGWFMVPIGLLFPREFEPWNKNSQPSHRMLKIFWPWDNYKDGIDGDVNWRRKRKEGEYKKFYCRYLWTAFRNPISNFKHWLGVDDVVVEKHIYGTIKRPKVWGHVGRAYVEVRTQNGKIYPMYYIGLKLWEKNGQIKGTRLLLGWKNFNVSPDELPKRYKYTFTITCNHSGL